MRRDQRRNSTNIVILNTHRIAFSFSPSVLLFASFSGRFAAQNLHTARPDSGEFEGPDNGWKTRKNTVRRKCTYDMPLFVLPDLAVVRLWRQKRFAIRRLEGGRKENAVRTQPFRTVVHF